MTRRNSKLAILAVIVLAVTTAGCGGEKFPAMTLAGNVTVGGELVAKGTIDFVPQGPGQGPAATAEIVQGRYQASVPPGPLRVFFQATRETGRTVEVFGQPQPETESIIPEQYQGGLEIVASPDKPRQDFSLAGN